MNSYSWSKAPLVRICIPFALGILLCAYYSGISEVTYIWMAAFFLALYLISNSIKNNRSKWLKAGAVAMFLSCMSAGMAVCQFNKLDQRQDFFANYTNDNSLILIRILKPLQEKENSFKGFAKVKAVINDEIKPASGRLILYFKKENLTRLPKYGDEIIISNTVKPILPPQNPAVFNYARFMSYKKIYHSAYLQPTQFQFTGKNSGYTGFAAIYALKEKLLATIDFYIEGPDERGIAKALLLGDETDVLPHVTASYAGTGTLHVLSVSGLHVGIIFLALNFFLQTFAHTRTGRFARVFILLTALIFYGILTGLSASVLRSVIMFCVLIVGMNFRKIYNVYNSMAFSALALLHFDPFLLMQLGFQLSYIALLGIVWLYPYIAKWWQPENKILAWIRDICAMSLAAQIATFPLGIFYFNQFPSYFLLSNLLVIPWSSLVLFAGCSFLLISLLPIPEIIISYAGKLIFWLIKILNVAVEKLSDLPFAQWEGTYLSTFECVLIYIGLALVIFAFIYKEKQLFRLSLAVFVVFFSFRSFDKFQDLQKEKLVVHAIPKTSAISIKEKNYLYLIGDSAFLENPDQRKFYINSYAFSNFVPKPYITPVKNASGFKAGNFYLNKPLGQFGNEKFLWLSSRNELIRENNQQDFSFIILSKNIKLRIAELKEKFSFEKVILTADNSFYRNTAWETECKALGIDCVNLQKDNSFALNIE